MTKKTGDRLQKFIINPQRHHDRTAAHSWNYIGDSDRNSSYDILL